MRCDICGNEATHHETTVRNGQTQVRNLCDVCARKHGVAGPARPGEAVPSIKALHKAMAKAVINAASAAAADQAVVAALACPACGLRFTQFRDTGRLGCGACYAAFEKQLAPVIERAHEGATHHVGRCGQPGTGEPAAGSVHGVPPVVPAAPAPPASSASVPASAPPALTPPAPVLRGSARPSSPAAPVPARPRRAAVSAVEVAKKVAGLREQLAAAIAAEQYERAATLRDQIATLEAAARSAGGAGASPA